MSEFSYRNGKSLFWVIVNLILVVIFYYGKGVISNLLRHSIFVKLGDATFYAYLIHRIVLQYYPFHKEAVQNDMFSKYFSFTYTLIITCLISCFLSNKVGGTRIKNEKSMLDIQKQKEKRE